MSMGEVEPKPASTRAARVASATMSRTPASSRNPTNGVIPTPATSTVPSAGGLMGPQRESTDGLSNREIEPCPAKNPPVDSRFGPTPAATLPWSERGLPVPAGGAF